MMWSRSLALWLCVAGILGSNLASGEEITCDPHYPYRTFDGTCNNLDHTEWGRTNSLFRRLLPAEYGDATGDTPRDTSVAGGALPNVRSVSLNVHSYYNQSQPSFMVMLMQWGQFLDHDITHAALSSSPTKCCSDPNILQPDYKHPDVTSGKPCNPIVVPKGDPYFDTDDIRCLEFTRSVGVKDGDGIRQQVNELTPFVDASQVYGADKALADELRSFKDGKLRTKLINGKQFLPEWDDESNCFKVVPGDYCFRAGDIRVNVYAGLSTMHTVFLRYHNKLCDRLHAKHPDWQDERLYQEARRIVGALMQKITYDEFLFTLLGRIKSEESNLLHGDFDYSYNSTLDPSLSNVFSAAAYRYGHSAIPDALNIDGTDIPTGQLYLRPGQTVRHLDGVVKALVSQPQQRVDIFYSLGVTNQLFEPPGRRGHGFDLAALNIHRGRDHGIPPYTKWREYCGLGKVNDWSKLPHSDKFQDIYKSMDDIDMYSGGLNEYPKDLAWVGPTIACLLTEQFRTLKFADRFWYENRADPKTAFSLQQIEQINNFRLAAILCHVTEVEKMQPNVFMEATGLNSARSCSTYHDLDIEQYW